MKNYYYILAVFLLLVILIWLWLYPTQFSCKITGGEWGSGGLAGKFRCVYTYPDADKSCNSSSECIGKCIVTEYGGSGKCKATSSPFGCYAIIEDIDTGIICFD
ncbi:MAG: hypothetical protein IIC69_01650 [Nanoarchaeota archaeon]|nr:hypothetical protein [Nanoarchaeota archaeon]